MYVFIFYSIFNLRCYHKLPVFCTYIYAVEVLFISVDSMHACIRIHIRTHACMHACVRIYVRACSCMDGSLQYAKGDNDMYVPIVLYYTPLYI